MAPTRQLHSEPIAVSGSGHPGKYINSLTPSSICKSAFKKTVLSRIQLTLDATHPTPHGASRMVQAMSACLVGETRRAPSRDCGGAWDYGHTTAAMRDIEYPPPGYPLTPPVATVHVRRRLWLRPRLRPVRPVRVQPFAVVRTADVSRNIYSKLC